MRLVWLAVGLSLAVSHASADENTADLATKLVKTVASLISVPFCAQPVNFQLVGRYYAANADDSARCVRCSPSTSCSRSE